MAASGRSTPQCEDKEKGVAHTPVAEVCHRKKSKEEYGGEWQKHATVRRWRKGVTHTPMAEACHCKKMVKRRKLRVAPKTLHCRCSLEWEEADLEDGR